jgi:hypothetical protein
VGLSFQIARAKNAPASASVRYSLRDHAGQTVATAAVPHERAVAVGAGIEGYDIGVRTPATAGRYVVTIEATLGQRSARRDVPIAVR